MKAIILILSFAFALATANGQVTDSLVEKKSVPLELHFKKKSNFSSVSIIFYRFKTGRYGFFLQLKKRIDSETRGFDLDFHNLTFEINESTVMKLEGDKIDDGGFTDGFFHAETTRILEVTEFENLKDSKLTGIQFTYNKADLKMKLATDSQEQILSILKSL
jgi:hypothetical protein